MQIKCLLPLIFLAAACGSNQENVHETAPPIPVLVVLPEVKDVPTYLDSVGILQASVIAEVRPQLGGTIAEVLVAEGDWVKPGTPLFKIDASAYEIKLQEAAAKVEVDKAFLAAAERKLKRFRSLADKDLISQVEWDEIETAAERALAVLEADKSGLRTAQWDVDHCLLTACIEGHVGRLQIHPGMLVSGGQAVPLATIVNSDPLFVEFMLTEKEVALLPPGQKKVEILSPFDTSSLGEGEVSFLDNHYDAKNGLLAARAKISNANLALRPGQVVKVRVRIGMLPNAKIVPQKSVKYNHEGPYLYVVGKENTVEMRKVALGSTLESSIIILEGLGVDDNVVTDGHLRLYPGSAVEVKI